MSFGIVWVCVSIKWHNMVSLGMNYLTENFDIRKRAKSGISSVSAWGEHTVDHIRVAAVPCRGNHICSIMLLHCVWNEINKELELGHNTSKALRKYEYKQTSKKYQKVCKDSKSRENTSKVPYHWNETCEENMLHLSQEPTSPSIQSNHCTYTANEHWEMLRDSNHSRKKLKSASILPLQLWSTLQRKSSKQIPKCHSAWNWWLHCK